MDLIKLRTALLALALSVITLGSASIYYKYKSFNVNSKIFQEGYKEGMSDCIEDSIK